MLLGCVTMNDEATKEASSNDETMVAVIVSRLVIPHYFVIQTFGFRHFQFVSTSLDATIR